jgi:cytochrome c2
MIRLDEVYKMTMNHEKTHLGKTLSALGVLLFTALLAGCASAPQTNGTNYDYAKLGTPVAQARGAGDFVLMWEVNGTPTPTPTPNPTDVVLWATINAGTPTVAPLNTIAPVSGAASAGSTQSAPASGDMGGMAGMDANAPGDPANGKAIFTGTGGCYACHDTQNGVTVVGPSLQHVAGVNIPKHAKAGQSPEDYLRESITAPNAVVVEGFPSGVMPQSFGQTLTAQQINDLIAYLLTLK